MSSSILCTQTMCLRLTGVRYSQTPLHRAASFSSDETLKLLLASGAEPNQPDYMGLPPLWDCSNLQNFKLLQNAGARWDFKGPKGETLLMNGNAPKDVVAYCLELKVDP